MSAATAVLAARRLLLAGGAAALALAWLPAHALGLPSAYGAMIIEPTGLPQRAEFDLSAAVQRAKRDNKRLYLYLGANDCRYCRNYEAFLAENAKELTPYFARDYLLVDLRSSLTVLATALVIKVGERSWSYTEFQRAIGDERARMLVYPTVWLLNADLKPLLQMPSGAGTFQTVAEQLEILRLEQ